MPLAPRFGPISSLQVAAPPPPSSSVKTTLSVVWLNVAECQNAKFTLSCTRSMIFGFSGSLMENSRPSPIQAPAARSFEGSTVMSWQPVVLETPGLSGAPGLPPSGKSTGKFTTAAFSGALRGTLMTEIPSCGGWQSGNVALGEYEETYTYTFLRSGTSVWVCDPHAVSTAATYFGLRLSLMSK